MGGRETERVRERGRNYKKKEAAESTQGTTEYVYVILRAAGCRRRCYRPHQVLRTTPQHR